MQKIVREQSFPFYSIFKNTSKSESDFLLKELEINDEFVKEKYQFDKLNLINNELSIGRFIYAEIGIIAKYEGKYYLKCANGDCFKFNTLDEVIFYLPSWFESLEF